MEAIIEYFNTIPSAHRSVILIGGLAFFFILENTLPLFTSSHNKWKHSGLNIFFTFTTILVNFSMAFILVNACLWVEDKGIGLFQWINMNIYLMLILGLVLLDLLSSWLPHWVQHQVTWMWKFHLIHHTDQHIDTTSANRHHPGESVIRFVFTTVSVIVLGVPLWMIFMYQSLSVVLTQFNHSNIKMPDWLDNLLILIFCTPNMHRVHHHYRRPYSDMNYGNIFSIWDRIFRTFIKVDNTKLKYGIDSHMSTEETENIISLLKIPFLPYRQPPQYEDKETL